MSVSKKIRNPFHREEAICPWWLAYTFDNPLRRFLHKPDQILGPYVKQGMTVADIGSGMGYFSLAMAEMVDANGKVIAVDIQQKMLDTLRRRAVKRGVAERICLVKAEKDDIGIKEPVDFVLTFWMVHETGNIPGFLGRVLSILKRDGAVLIVEPRMHVSRRDFEQTLQQAREAGFTVMAGPKVRISRSALLRKN